MHEENSRQPEKFRAGIGTWIRMILVGAICAALLPILPLLVSATFCGWGFLCILVDHSPWVFGISAALALLGGMFLIYQMAKYSHRKRFEDQPFRPETLGDRRTENMVERRKADARVAWMNKLGRERDQTRPPRR